MPSIMNAMTNFPSVGNPERQSASQSPNAPQQPEQQKNTVGLIAMITGIVGFVFACIPGALIVGWVLLPIAFILGIVGVVLSGKKKGTSITAIILAVVGTIVGIIVFLVLVADAADEAFSQDDLSAADTKTDEAADGSDGSRESPLPIGETVANDDWEVTLGDPREAGEEVSAENQFNDPPQDGMEFWIVPVEATYTGSDTGYAGFDISVKFVSSDNRTYDGRCGVIPDNLEDVGELYEGGEAEGNVCVEVPAGTDGLWSVTTGFGDPVFFTAE